MEEIKRSRLLALGLLLSLLLVIDAPDGSLKNNANLLLFVLWASILATSWSIWFKRSLSDLFWVLAIFCSTMLFIQKIAYLPLFALVVWRLWLGMREKRSASMSLIIFLLLGTTSFVNAQDLSKGGDNFKYLTGFEINDLTSCGQVDLIPWKFKDNNRQTRLLLRDKLRLSTEKKYSDWSVHQVMDPDGIVTFIFQRLQEDGASEYLITKGAIFNRIVKRGRERRVTEMRNLSNLIDSPAFEFFHKDGSRVTFLPGSSGNSKLRVYLAAKPGSRVLPPLFLEGRSCTKPESAFDVEEDTENPSTMNAPAFGGSAAAAGSEK